MLGWPLKSGTSAAAEGNKRVLPALDGCPVSTWSVRIYVSERGRHNGCTAGAWMHSAVKGQMFRGSATDAGSEPHWWAWGGFGLPVALPREGWPHSSSRLPVWLLSVCWGGDGSSESLTKFLSAWWANSGLRALFQGDSSHDVISTVMDGQHVCSSVS